MPAALRRWRISLPVLNTGIAFSDTATAAPVRGLRPRRASRRFTEKAPKPRSSTRSPRASASAMVSRIALTSDLDVALVEMRVLLGDLEDELRLDHGVWSSRRSGASRLDAPSGRRSGLRAPQDQHAAAVRSRASAPTARSRAARPSRPRRSAPTPSADQRREVAGRWRASSPASAGPWDTLRAFSSQATAWRSLPSSSTSFSGTLWRPLKTRPSETAASWPPSMPAPLGHQVLEPGIGVADHGGQGGARLRARSG